jgi:hypothetical protein
VGVQRPLAVITIPVTLAQVYKVQVVFAGTAIGVETQPEAGSHLVVSHLLSLAQKLEALGV